MLTKWFLVAFYLNHLKWLIHFAVRFIELREPSCSPSPLSLSWVSSFRKSFFWLSRNILIIINSYFGWIKRKLMNVSSTEVFALDFKVRRRSRKINVELFSLRNNYNSCFRHWRELALLSRQSIWRFPSVQVDNGKSIIHKSKKRHFSFEKTFTHSFLPYNSLITGT